MSILESKRKSKKKNNNNKTTTNEGLCLWQRSLRLRESLLFDVSDRL